MEGSKKILFKLLAITTVFSCMNFCLPGCDDKVDPLDYIITYIPDRDNPPDNTIALMWMDSEDDILLLAVDAYNITHGNVHSLYFDLIFRDELMHYVSYEIGGTLEEVGEVSYQVALDSQDSGRLVVGMSLIGNVSIETLNDIVIILRFEPDRTGTCPFWFENANLLDNDGAEGQPISGISWYGGHAFINK